MFSYVKGVIASLAALGQRSFSNWISGETTASNDQCSTNRSKAEGHESKDWSSDIWENQARDLAEASNPN